MRILHWLTTAADLLSGRRRRRKGPLTYSEQLENRALLTPFIVTSFGDGADANPGDGVAQTATGETTLRAAVQEANALPAEDQILLLPGEYELTIPDAGEDSAASGSLVVTDSLSILGAASEQTTIDAGAIDQLFEIQAGAALRLEELTITGAETQSEAVDVTDGTLQLDDVTIESVSDTDSGNSDADEPSTEAGAVEEQRAPIRVDPIITNDRQADLLKILFIRPLEAVDETPILLATDVAEPVDFYSLPDAALGVSATADPQTLPGENSPTRQSRSEDEPGRLAQQPDEENSTTKRRREVINTLFEKDQSKQKTDPAIQPTSAEEVKREDPLEDRPAPPPLPIEKSEAVPLESGEPENHGPEAPPLPELKNEHSIGQRAASGESLIAGIVALSVTRPRDWRRRLKRLTGWKWLVV